MTSPESPAVPEPCTNWYHTRRHYSVDLASSTTWGGRKGHALCWVATNPVDVWDQVAMDKLAEQYRSKRVVIADLLPCKKCARKIGALS